MRKMAGERQPLRRSQITYGPLGERGERVLAQRFNVLDRRVCEPGTSSRTIDFMSFV